MKNLLLVLSVPVLLAPVTPQQIDAKPVTSAVVPWSPAPQAFPWGEMRRAFTGESAYTQKLFVSSFVLKAGMEVHPPHQHSQEEFMTMVEGEGTWHLDGKEIPAKKGDVIYVAPWVWHGLKNTGDKDLIYFVAQWNPKAMDPAPKPAAGK